MRTSGDKTDKREEKTILKNKIKQELKAELEEEKKIESGSDRKS